MAKLNIGDAAPDFELADHEGKTVTLAQFRGKKNIVLYFYPKDETPGCVKEACMFRDQYESFTDAGAEVIGISSDSVASHALFRLSRRLPFILLSDPKGKTRKGYGVSGSFLGLAPGRETFVIDKGGIVRMKFASQLKIESHINEALSIIKELDKPTHQV